MSKQIFDTLYKTSPTLRIVILGVLALALLIPVSMIDGLVNERQRTRESAVAEAGSKWGNAQTILGPVMSIPLTNDENISTTSRRYLYILPNTIEMDGIITPQVLKRGIHDIPVYTATIAINGTFSSETIARSLAQSDYGKPIWEEAAVLIGIPDMRGIEENITLSWNDQEIPMTPCIAAKDVAASGVSARVPVNVTENEKEVYTFYSNVVLKGSENIQFVPIGNETSLRLSSEWQSPSFDGAFLPDSRSVSSDGFKAEWNILNVNRNYPQLWRGAEYSVDDSVFGVRLFVPVDEYQKTTRAVKYAFLFIVLTFGLFFFIEITKKLPIHPVQYILVGLALSLFYLLLLSISEHAGFTTAYIIASIAIVLLSSAYAKSIFKRTSLVIVQAGLLALLYLFLYILLQLQDFALLVGSIGLLVVLAVVMYVSRNINWFANTEKEE